MIIPKEKQTILTKALYSYLEEYLRLSQEISFNGNKTERAELNEYVGTIFDYLIQMALNDQDIEWDFDKFKEAKAGWLEEDASENEIIEAVIYNLGVHESSLYSGEKWEVEERTSTEIIFRPKFKEVSVKMNDLMELKEKFPQIKDIQLDSFQANLGEVNLLLKLFLDA